MSSNQIDSIAGLIYGSFVADSLALGTHWIYGQRALRRDYGRVTDFFDPRKDSVHRNKIRGQQTHYGDQALTLMESIEIHRGFEFAAFVQDWQRMWSGYSHYVDQATKETLKNLNAGSAAAGAASKSDELGGAARIAPLLATMANKPIGSVVAAARAQTALTHGSKAAGDAAEFLTRLVFSLLDGATLRAAIDQAVSAAFDELDMRKVWIGVEATRSLEIAAAAKSLGLACPTPQALPTLLMLLDRCGDDFETAAIENVMAGGDNAARGLALGMILGARHGNSRIPTRWLDELEAAPRIEAFLQKLRAHEA